MFMRRTTIGRIAFLAALIALAAVQSRRLVALRKSGLPESYAGYTTQEPPALTFILAGLGGFRGIVAEILWFRAERLQNEGRYLELVQLSDWLTRLDPHSSETWAYNAWNLAYNISAMMARAEDRLRWVRNGIRLLRDDALRYNPRDAKLYRELAWMYLNKVGDSYDTCHLAYKLDLAAAMQPYVTEAGTILPTDEVRKGLAALRLDAGRMREIEKQFGPVDWRLAESHSLYWACAGLPFSKTDKKNTEQMLLRRIMYQSLMVSVFRGRLESDPSDSEHWKVSGNLALAPAAERELRLTMEQFPSRNMDQVYLHFVGRLAATEKLAGNDWQADFFYRIFQSNFPAGQPCPTMQQLVEDVKNEE